MCCACVYVKILTASGIVVYPVDKEEETVLRRVYLQQRKQEGLLKTFVGVLVQILRQEGLKFKSYKKLQ